MHDSELPLHTDGVCPPARHFLATVQSEPALAMQLTCSGERCAPAEADGSLMSEMNCVQALMPPTMMPHPDAVRQAAAPDCCVTVELPQPAARTRRTRPSFFIGAPT